MKDLDWRIQEEFEPKLVQDLFFQRKLYWRKSMYGILPLLLECTCAHTERQKDVTSRVHSLASKKSCGKC